MTRGRLPRALAAGLLVIGIGVAVLVVRSRREIEGRFWLWRAVRDRADVRIGLLARAAALLGPDDPRLRELLVVDPGDIEVTFPRVLSAAPERRISPFSVEVGIELSLGNRGLLDGGPLGSQSVASAHVPITSTAEPER